MATTFKRCTYCCTQEAGRQLDYLCKDFQENVSQVITRAIQLLYFTIKVEQKEETK